MAYKQLRVPFPYEISLQNTDLTSALTLDKTFDLYPSYVLSSTYATCSGVSIGQYILFRSKKDESAWG